MVKARKPIDYEELNPGIRLVVRWLRREGFETINSGDGRTHACVCDVDFPFVAIRVKPKRLVKDARRLVRLLAGMGFGLGEWTEEGLPKGMMVDATYSSLTDEAFLQLAGLDDAMLVKALGGQPSAFGLDGPEQQETPAAMAGVDGGEKDF